MACLIPLLAVCCCAADVVFDGSATRDPSGRPLQKFVWTKTSTANDVVLSAAIDRANTLNSPRLVIPGSGLRNLATGEVTLTATNYLGVAATSDPVGFTKQASGLTPVVAVIGGPAQSFYSSQGISISTQLVASSVCSGSKVREPRLVAAASHWQQACASCNNAPRGGCRVKQNASHLH